MRLVGNEAAHPGQIDFKEERTLVSGQMGVINQSVREAIGEPKRHEEFCASLPKEAQAKLRKT